MKKHVWRPGDRVRVINPLWVARVGYPLIWYDLMDEVCGDLRVAAAWDVLHGHEPRLAPKVVDNGELFLPGFAKSPTEGVPLFFLQAAAKARVAERNFGGNERKILYNPSEHSNAGAGSVLEVIGKRVVKTGLRFSASSWVSHEGEQEYESGGLSDIKTHILLHTNAGEIEAANVELVSADTKFITYYP